MRKLKAAAVCILLTTLVGCAGPSTQAPNVSTNEIADEKLRQQVYIIRSYVNQSARLSNVAFRIVVANQRDCREAVGARLGIQTASLNDFPSQTRDAWTSALDLKPAETRIIVVATGSPAAKAGLRVGDMLVALNGQPIPDRDAGPWIVQQISATTNQRIQVTVRRNDKPINLEVLPVKGCTIPVVLAQQNNANAFTDGKQIVIQSGIMRVAQTDSELALIVGHELAHVTMGHLQKRAQNQVAGAVGGAAVDVLFALARVNTGGAFSRQGATIGGVAFAKDFEKEADYVGAYYAARAGYEITGAERLWRAMAQEDTKQLSYAGLHPTSPERFVQMQKTVEEISTKRTRHVSLDPEPRKQTAESPVDRSGAESL
jgi:Zn-dependent protease with chaperone function